MGLWADIFLLSRRAKSLSKHSPIKQEQSQTLGQSGGLEILAAAVADAASSIAAAAVKIIDAVTEKTFHLSALQMIVKEREIQKYYTKYVKFKVL